MKLLQSIIILCLIFLGYVQAIVNGIDVTKNDWRSVALVEFIDPDSGNKNSCTAVIISANYAITSASCMLHEESSKLVAKAKVCIGEKLPFKNADDVCIESEQIYTHHQYMSNSDTSVANNLAYVKFNNPLNLTKFKVKPVTLVTPSEFSEFVAQSSFPDITWVGFDAKGLGSPVLGIKQQGKVTNAEFDYQTRSIVIKSSQIRPGNHYQGTASFIQTASGDWRLLGLLSDSSPDNIIVYYPEINPCDEDPIIVRYPKPLIQVTSHITVFPVAACSMAIFVESDGYEESSCHAFLENNLNLSDALDKESPIALRQHALAIYRNSHSMDDSGEIYKYLYLAMKAGDLVAPVILSKFLYEGKLLSKDNDKAIKFITELANSKDPSASLLLAKIMLFPESISEIVASTNDRDSKLYSLLKVAADSGLVDAQYLLARLYQSGVGVKQSHRKAYHWYAMAAMQGHSDGQYQLGMQWSDGRGVRVYREVAQFWIKQAAAHGHFDAQNQLGMLKPVTNQ